MKMNFGKIASPIASRLLVIAGFVFFSIAFVCAFVHSLTVFDSFSSASGAFLAAVIALLAVSALAMNRRVGKKAFIIIVPGVALALRLIWALLVDTPPSSDFLFMHNAALAAAKGDFSFASSDYYTSWAYQLGFTMYEALIVKLFGTPIIFLKVINVLWSTGTVALVYWTAGKAFNEFCGRAAAIAYAFYIPNIVMCSVLTNQHVSMFFFMLGCALLVHRGLTGKYSWLLIGLSFAIGHIMRPIGGVYIAALLVFVTVFRAFPWSLKRSGPLLAKTAGIVVVFYLLQATVSQSFIQRG
ncbi:hypothetical protein D3H35_29175 [Cohnella faecalis]|uniref:Glycosyltransferase RgtA/B/C/D-like domain-containing protein n=2 Tax=Cohnella faecalis TaxID=2315694 RepID=A0A398CGW6_9BACL|nr:hypothetical protein D3H35_29175 [Cohnella faecalis]